MSPEPWLAEWKVRFAPLSPDSRFLSEFNSLSQEKDPDLFFANLLQWGRRLEAEYRLEAAGTVYAAIAEAPAPSETRRAAQSRLNAMTGSGASAFRAEFLLRHLASETLAPATLAGLSAGAAAFRAIRSAALFRLAGSPGATFFTRGFGARAAASLLGLGAEATVFPLATRGTAMLLGRNGNGNLEQVGREIAGSFLTLGSMKLAGWGMSAAARRGWESHRAYFQQAGMLAGIYSSHRLETAAGLRAESGGNNALVDSLALLVQVNVAGRLAPGLGSDRLGNGEGTSVRRRPRPRWLPEAAFATFPSARPELRSGASSRSETLRHYFFSQRHGSETPPPQTRSRALRNRFLPLFPTVEWASRAPEIVQAVCRIRCQLPDFHERLLESLVRAPDAGSAAQLYVVLALEDVFASDAVRTATGSFDDALLQMLVGNAVSESDGSARDQILQEIFRGMEDGDAREDWIRLATGYGYGAEPAFATEPLYTEGFWNAHGTEAGEAWTDYRPEDRVALFNFAYRHSRGIPEEASRIIQTFGAGRRDGGYTASEVEDALDYALRIPQTPLVLQRLYDVFAVEDSPGKLAEIPDSSDSIADWTQILTEIRRGRSRESLAFELNGSSHTAYFNDVRLARKVISVFEDVAPYLQSSLLREQNKARLVQAFDHWTAKSGPLEAADLFQLLEVNRHPVTESFTVAWLARKFEVEIVPAPDFDRRVAEWGRTKDCDLSIFFPKGGSGGQGIILVKDLPNLRFDSEEGRNHAFAALMGRVKALAHEAEHWRHITGYFFGTERTSRPFLLTGISREERYISEIMAYLEEFRWRAINLDLDFWEISRRLGQTLPVYLRGIADRSYFGASNEEKALH